MVTPRAIPASPPPPAPAGSRADAPGPAAASPVTTVVLDDLDRRLLAVLQVDASLTNLELAARVHTSPPTCLRRVRRLRATGVIERKVAIVAPTALGPTLSAVVEITLDNQAEDRQAAFATRVDGDPAILQSYRVSPGPDFVLLAQVTDMTDYQALAQRLFGPGSNVRNVRTYFVVARTKYETRIADALP